MLAHVLGGVDHEEKGNAGIELALNKELQGKSGFMRTKADVRQTRLRAAVFTDAEPGKNITLTIDERIQFIAERELAAAVKEHRREDRQPGRYGPAKWSHPGDGELPVVRSQHSRPSRGESRQPAESGNHRAFRARIGI